MSHNAIVLPFIKLWRPFIWLVIIRSKDVWQIFYILTVYLLGILMLFYKFSLELMMYHVFGGFILYFNSMGNLHVIFIFSQWEVGKFRVGFKKSLPN